jgi:hypothetical protein
MRSRWTATISLLALNGLRVSEATGADIEHLGLERGHRTLTVTRKGGKVVTVPLAPRTARAIDLAIGERTEGPVFLTRDGRRLDRHGAGRIVRTTARRAGIGKIVTPHTLRHAFITAASYAGVPLHIAQVIAGHRDINVTLGYKAVYPDEAIQAHLAFLARRRALRPTEEYRTPTDAEWEEFLGHFERRKVATGTCGRAFGTPCIHEHSCLRCSMHWPDPAQRNRIAEIRDNLTARIAEADREGWLGEAEGLKISLAGAQDKLAQIDRRTSAPAPVGLGMPALSRTPTPN